MNLLTIIMLLIIAFFAMRGYRKGLVKSFTSMFFFIAFSAGIYVLTPYISDFLKESTPVYGMVEEKCREIIEEKMEHVTKTAGVSQDTLIEELELPAFLEKQIQKQMDSSNTQITSAIDEVTKMIADKVLKILTFVVTIIVVNLIWRIGMMILKTATSLPGIHGIDRCAGMVFGGVQGLLIVWIILLIIMLTSHTEAGEKIMPMLRQSPVLEFFYDTNIFLWFFAR